MADTFRDSVRSELQAVITAQSITWNLKDTLNSDDPIDALTNYITLSFMGGTEDPYWFGSPGTNGWGQRDVVLIDIVAVAGSDTVTAESYARKIRDAFRNRRWATSDGLNVRVLSVSPLGGGQDDRVAWSETVALEIRTTNIG